MVALNQEHRHLGPISPIHVGVDVRLGKGCRKYVQPDQHLVLINHATSLVYRMTTTYRHTMNWLIKKYKEWELIN
jgi:hypothetical protein